MTEKGPYMPVDLASGAAGEVVIEHESPQEVTFWEALGEGADFDADAYDHEGEL